MASLSPARRAKIEARTDELYREYLTLRQLREKLQLTQVDMAERIGMKQSEISKLETGDRRLMLGTLAKIIAAAGGEWELTVTLPDTPPVCLFSSEDFVEEELPPPAKRPHSQKAKAAPKTGTHLVRPEKAGKV
jgi:transcriptional regulator with XRE-family HTH domain